MLSESDSGGCINNTPLNGLPLAGRSFFGNDETFLHNRKKILYLHPRSQRHFNRNKDILRGGAVGSSLGS